jgi:hypothetical protein
MIKKFYETTRPEPGKARIHYGKADDSKIAYEIAHGVNTRTSLVVRYHVVDVRDGFTGRSCTPLDLGGGGGGGANFIIKPFCSIWKGNILSSLPQ